MHLEVLIACLLLTLQAWRGWKRGVVRQGINLLALVCACGGGCWIYDLFVSKTSHFPNQQLLGIISSFLVGAVIYFFIKIPAALLFKETHQQSSPLVRFFYGLGGAVGAIIVGIFILWGASFVLIPFTGTFSSTTNSAKATFGESAQSAYKIIYQASRIASDPQAMARFLQYPDMRKILQTKAVSQLLSNPQFTEAASRYEMLPLLLSSEFYQTLKNPEVEQAMKNIDLKKALDYALPTQN